MNCRLSAFTILGLGILCGCGPKAQLRDDPFLPPAPGSRPTVPVAPRATDPFQSASDSARQRDFARGVSTSPVTDPLVDPNERYQPGGAPELTPPVDGAPQNRADAGADRRYPADPDLSSPWDEPASAPTAVSAVDAQPKENTPGDTYQSVRQRLDKVGAKNIRSEKESNTGDYVFHCELEHPREPGVLRVFEARHASEEKAMLAVTESAERWHANPQ